MAELQDSPGGLINQFAVRPEAPDPPDPEQTQPEPEQQPEPAAKHHRLPGVHGKAKK